MKTKKSLILKEGITEFKIHYDLLNYDKSLRVYKGKIYCDQVDENLIIL